MIIKKPFAKLTNRDFDILNVLWNSSTPMTATEIVNTNPELTVNTVQAVLRKLLNQKLIEVADIVYSGTVLCRSYKPTMCAQDFALAQFADEFRQLNAELSTSSLVAAILNNEKNPEKKEEEIQKLEQFLKDYKQTAKK